MRRIAKRAHRIVLATIIAMFVATGATAFAQGDQEIPPGFEPIKGSEARAQSVDANVLVVGAYGAILVLMFGFVIYVVRTQSQISKEMSELASKLDKAGG